MDSPTPALEECLKLLGGARDEQRLAGLLLAAKFLKSDDPQSILKVHDAVGPRFLDRLLMTGMGNGSDNEKGEEERVAYLRLAVTVIAAFCRLPVIASSKEMVARVPVIAEIISKSLDPDVYEECYEVLVSVVVASENYIRVFYEPRVMKMLAPNISNLHEGSRALELAIRLLQLIINKLPMNIADMDYLSGISCMVVSIARQFGLLHNALKFDALHILTTLLSSNNESLYDALRTMPDNTWRNYVQAGIMEILQNRVVSSEKLQALLLAESMMSILGENWILEQSKLHDHHHPLPIDKGLLLVLESARVEVAVLLNELGYLKFEASRSTSSTAETIALKQRNLAISFSLIEKIIKLVSNASGVEGSPVRESTVTKAIVGLDETINIVLVFLQDSKDHGQKKGDDLLAATRIIGSYLAEAPFACKEKTRDLVEYILSIEGEDESSPFYSVCFLLPMLCQITMEIEGCKILASFGGHKHVAEFLAKMIMEHRDMVDDSGTILLACDTILNILLKRTEARAPLEGSHFVHLLQALALWTEGNDDPTEVMIASSICALVFDLTSEELLLEHSGFDSIMLGHLSRLISRSLNQGQIRKDATAQLDLHHITAAGYSRWAGRFPSVRNAVERA